MFIDPELQKALPAQPEYFDYFMQLEGEKFRALEGRKTQRVILNGQAYFIKQHFGVGWKEIIKNLLQFKLPILSAKNEWLAIERLKELSILTASALAYGRRGLNPARLESFLLMKELAPMSSLEDFCRPWKQQPPPFALKLSLIHKIAHIAKTLHENGINHRDFYLCHFLLDSSEQNLYLLDLHRAGLHRKLRSRWLIKDLAGLYFSSKEIGLNRRDWWRFMKAYRQQTLRDIIATQADFWQKVKKRGEKLYHAQLQSS